MSSRKNAKRLIREIPELAVRPMLLALIPDLAVAQKSIHELYELYAFMVDRWLERESKWVDSPTLLAVSKRLAVFMYAEKGPGQGDRVNFDELTRASQSINHPIDWKHLTARSLLNRDSEGNFKFAHRSIMEYLFVAAAIDGDERCFNVIWTDLMRDLFVSWGSTAAGIINVERAIAILRMDLRVTHLAPLSLPPESPRPLAASDITKKLTRSNSLYRSRPIPVLWRAESLRIIENDNVYQIFDLGYDLVWRLGRIEQFSNEIDRRVFRGPFAEFIRKSPSSNATQESRLPSLDEFLSLMEAEAAINRGVLLDRSELYWLDNQLGKSRHLVVSISDTTVTDELLTQISGTYSVAKTNTTIRVYEVSPKVRTSRRRGNLVATAVMVRSGGSEQGRYVTIDGT